MALSRLRRLLGVDGVLLLADDRLALDRRVVWWDVAAFDAVRQRLHEAMASIGDAAVVVALARRLAALYKEPLYGGESVAAWGIAARERLVMAWQRAVQDASEWLESRSLWRAAIEIYERGLEQQVLAESLYRGLMRCHRGLDERTEALLVYRRCRDLLVRLLGVAPSEETKRLSDEIRGADDGG